MIRRHLDYPEHTPVTRMGRAALDDLLDRGDLEDWEPLLAAIRAQPDGALADTILELCRAHEMYGTSALWRTWIERLRSRGADATPLSELRRRRGVTQDEVGRRMGVAQSDVSKIERRADVRLSTLRAYVEATGGRLEIRAAYPDGVVPIA